MKNGTDVKAKVIEVNPDNIRYKQWDNQDGPIFTVLKRDILLITYQNGQKSVLSDEPSVDALRVFAYAPSKVVTDMSYRDYKRLYNINDYRKLQDPAYRTSRCLFNLLFPGVAQYTMREGGIATGFVIPSTISLVAIGFGSFYIQKNAGISKNDVEAGSWIIVGGVATYLTLMITSTINAARIAQYKSLYINDLDALGKEYSVKLDINPMFTQIRTNQNVEPVFGLQLNVLF